MIKKKCKTCHGRGWIYDPNEEPDVIEGYKLVNKFPCPDCPSSKKKLIKLAKARGYKFKKPVKNPVPLEQCCGKIKAKYPYSINEIVHDYDMDDLVFSKILPDNISITLRGTSHKTNFRGFSVYILINQ